MRAFSTGVPVDWGLSQRPARVDCGLSYTTGQATIVLCAIVACSSKRRCRSSPYFHGRLLSDGDPTSWSQEVLIEEVDLSLLLAELLVAVASCLKWSKNPRCR